MDTKGRITEVTPLKEVHSNNKNSWDKFKVSFDLLRLSPRDLYIAYFMKTTSIIGYCSVSIIRPIYFSTGLGFSDLEVGLLLAAKGVIAGFYSITLGSIPDKYGIKLTMVLTQTLSAFGCIVVIFASNRWVKSGMVIGPILLGFSFVMTTIKLAIKRFTLPAAHSIAFYILYMLLCFGEFISGKT